MVAREKSLISRRMPCFIGGIFASIALLSNCAESSKTSLFVNSEFRVGGTLDASLVKDSESIRFYAVDANASLVKLETAELQTATQKFSLSIDEEILLSEPFSSEHERIAMMGSDIPDSILKNLVPDREHLGFARIVALADGDLTSQTQTTATMAQVYMRVPRKSRMESNHRISVSSSASKTVMREVGTLPVKVVDENSAAIPQALVGVISSSYENYVFNQSKPILPWEDLGYSPIRFETDSDGKVVVFGIPLAADNRSFQIYAWADGYCTAVSNQLQFPSDELVTPLVLTLQLCDKELLQATEYKFATSQLPDAYVGTDSDDSGMIYASGSMLKLKVHALSRSIAPLNLKLFIGDSAEGDAILDETIPAFVPEIQLSLPVTVTGSKEDRLKLLTQVKAEAPAGSNSEVVEKSFLYSSLSTSAVAGDFALYSEVGVEGIISGLENRSFELRKIKSYGCSAGESYGALLQPVTSDFSASDARLVECDEASLKLTLNDTASHSSISQSGEKDFKILIRNRFGVLSDSTSSTADEISVMVDATRPDLSIGTLGDPLTLGVEFGIVSSSASGTSHIFGSPQVRLKSSNLSNYAFVFASASSCRTLESDMSGDLHKIYDFRIAASDFSEPESMSGSVKCDGEKLNLSSAIISIPTSGTGAASFYLQVRDLAGNISSSRRYEISSCSSAPTADFCWEL